MLQDQLQNDLKQAQLARDNVRVSTLRLLLSEIHNAQIQSGPSESGLSDQDIISIIQKESKKRKEAAAGFRQGNREEQAQKEETELKVLESYLPAKLNNEELTKLIEDTINNVGAKNIEDIGRVMVVVMSRVKGQADGSVVSSIVREKLQ